MGKREVVLAGILGFGLGAAGRECVGDRPVSVLVMYQDARLSNGLIIPRELITAAEKLEQGIKYIVETGYGPEHQLEVFDEWDGRPYVLQGELTPVRDGEGNVKGVEEANLQKRFDLTYEYGGVRYPLWEPTAFRGHPDYRAGLQKLSEEARERETQQDTQP